MSFSNDSPIKVYLSNRTEVLVEALSKNLECSIACNPFSRRLLFAQTTAGQAWLKQNLAVISKNKIGSGFKINNLKANIELLRFYLRKEGQTKRLPSHLELTLAIENLLRKIIFKAHTASLTEQEIELWSDFIPLFIEEADSGENENARLDQGRENKLLSLSQEVAKLFLLYGEYAPHLVKNWEETPSSCWQQLLWQELFSKSSPWTPLCHALEIEKPAEPLELHLFGISHLSSTLHTFFADLSAFVPVTYYLFSPCQLFWSDIVSDRQRVLLQRKWQQKNVSSHQLLDLELFLRDRNPILANFGSLGKQLAKQIEESTVETFEDYRISSSCALHSNWSDLLALPLNPPEADCEKNSFTALEALQTDITLLRSPGEQVTDLAPSDDTIQIHRCCSPFDEVRIAYNVIHKLILRHKNDDCPLEPADIIIAAPDISLYAPFLQALFSGSSSPFDYQLLGVSTALLCPYIRTFFRLLDLAKSRWEAFAVLELFEQPSFRRKHGIEKEALALLKEWLAHSKTSWGFDACQRKKLLEDAGCHPAETQNDDAIGTWFYALERLVLSLAIEKEGESRLPPIEGVDFIQTDRLNACIEIFCKLRAQLSPIESNAMHPISAWADYLAQLLEENLLPQPNDSKEKESHLLLLQTVQEIRSTACLDADALFPFSSIYQQLKESLKQRSNHLNSLQLHGIRCGSFQELQGISCHVTICLGMEEAAFPRSEKRSALNFIYEKESRADYMPTSQEWDRYLFLQALLCSRRYFVAVYTGYSSDGKEQSPSMLLSELLDYLDNNYRFADALPSSHCFHRHPFVPFDPAFFLSDALWPNAAERWYHIASAAGENREEKNEHRFLSTFVSPEKKPDSDVLTIELQNLITLARDPIKLYFNKGLGIYLENEKRNKIQKEDSFSLNGLENAILMRKAIKEGFEKTVAEAEKNGLLPVGALKKVAIDALFKEYLSVKNHLHSLQIDPASLFKVVFCPSCNEMERLERGQGWRLPPIEYTDSQGSFRITGTIDNLFPGGIIFFLKDDKKQICRAWPEYLVAAHLAQKSILSSPQLILAKSGKVKSSFFTDPSPFLSSFIRYYHQALKAPSPLLPEWCWELAENSSADFALQREKQFNNPFLSTYNEYLLWSLGHKPAIPEAAEWANLWQQTAKEVYGPLFTNWY